MRPVYKYLKNKYNKERRDLLIDELETLVEITEWIILVYKPS